MFISSSKAHTIYIEKQKLQPDKQIRQLQRLVDTCWACSYNAINALCYTFDAVVSTLEYVGRENNNRAVEAKGLAKSKNIEVELSPQKRKRCLSTRLHDCIVMESTGNRELPSEIDNLKTCVYYPVLDFLISDNFMKKRFNEKNMMLLKSIHACAPDSNSFWMQMFFCQWLNFITLTFLLFIWKLHYPNAA